MTSINIHEAKTHLSRYAKRIKAGETVVLCDRNQPFAEIRPLPASAVLKPIRFGVAKGEFDIPEAFDAPFADFEDDFYTDSQ